MESSDAHGVFWHGGSDRQLSGEGGCETSGGVSGGCAEGRLPQQQCRANNGSHLDPVGGRPREISVSIVRERRIMSRLAGWLRFLLTMLVMMH